MSDEIYAIGLDLGGTSVKYGICNQSGQIIREFHRPSRADQPVETIVQNLQDACREALDFARQQDLTIHVIGMGTPGSVDVERGYLKGNTPNFAFWRDVEIKKELERALSLPVWVDNDANVMAYGETRYGAGKGYSHAVCVTLGTGIGGGIIIGNQLFRGSNYSGAEIGHMSIKYDGLKCRCGGTGCWELYASATAMISYYNELNPPAPASNTLEIFEAYHRGETIARLVVEREIRLAAVGMVNLINIFNPRVIIIGGGVSEAGDWFIERIEEEALLHAMKPAIEELRIVRAQLGNKAGWLGAAAFALDMDGSRK